jgi:hypothetical protein
LTGLTEEAGVSTEQLEALERQFRQDLLRLGAAGRLLVAGKIEARQDAQAKRLLDGGRFALIILGGHARSVGQSEAAFEREGRVHQGGDEGMAGGQRRGRGARPRVSANPEILTRLPVASRRLNQTTRPEP